MDFSRLGNKLKRLEKAVQIGNETLVIKVIGGKIEKTIVIPQIRKGAKRH